MGYDETDKSFAIASSTALGTTNAFKIAKSTLATTLGGSLTVTGAVLPSSNDVGALGVSGTAWSDVFLASGAVIDFAAGDMEIRHSSGLLTLNGGFKVDSGAVDFGPALSVEIPNSTNPTVDAVGELAWDTSPGGNLKLATSTTGHVVLGSATTTLYSFSVASTSPDMVSGGIIELPPHHLPQVATAIACKVDAGTSWVINLDDGTNNTNAITCTTTWTQYALTSNQSWTAGEQIRLEGGTKTGSVDYAVIRILGYRTSD